MDKKAYAGQGFSLIELMFVVFIVSIVVAIGTFTYLSQIQLITLRNDIRELNQTIQVARMRTLAAGVGHGVLFDTANNRYVIFVDCDNDEQFSDTDGNYANNNPVETAQACAASSYDPLMDRGSIYQLDSRNHIVSTPGGQNYIIFNNLGQTIQNAAPIFGDIILRGTPDDGLVYQGIIHVNASGISEVRPVVRVHK